MSSTSTLAITTVTYNDRKTLPFVVAEFLHQTKVPKDTVWYFVLQNCSDAFADKIKELCREFVTCVIVRFDQNLGLSKAMSYIIKLTEAFRFTLNIEDDWVLLKERVPNLFWLENCLEVMEKEPGLSTIFLRAYNNAKEKWQYGWTRTIPYRCHKYRNNFNYEAKVNTKPKLHEKDGCFYREVENMLFTFNPCLVRNKDYQETAYPLPVFPKDQKADGQNADWGNCEALTMERTRHLLTYWLNEGVFGHHEDWFPVTN